VNINLASLVHSLKALGINNVVRFNGPAGDGGPAQGAQGSVPLFSLGMLYCCGELTKNRRSTADGGAAGRLHGGQGDRGVGAVVMCPEEVLTITSMLSAGKVVFYRHKDKEMLADAARQRFKFQRRNAGKAATVKPRRFKFRRAGGGAPAGLHLALPVISGKTGAWVKEQD
jgi:hypothetical protein